MPSTIIGAITIGVAGSGRGKRADTIRVVSFWFRPLGRLVDGQQPTKNAADATGTVSSIV